MKRHSDVMDTDAFWKIMHFPVGQEENRKRNLRAFGELLAKVWKRKGEKIQSGELVVK
jgi:hypothetical protein